MMKRFPIPATVLLTLLVCLRGGTCTAHERPTKPETPQDRAAYSLGYQIGQDLKHQQVEVRPDAVTRGATDGLTGAEPLLGSDEMRRTLLELKRRITSQAAVEARQQEARQRAEEERFLAENAKKEGVVVLPSGLQYKVLREGAGRQPGPNDQVSVQYQASLIDGVEFDSAEGEPVSFAVRDVIPGWREGLQLMQEGAHLQLFVPRSLGYGVAGPLANRAVILDVELLKVLDEEGRDAAAAPGASQEGESATPEGRDGERSQ